MTRSMLLFKLNEDQVPQKPISMTSSSYADEA